MKAILHPDKKEPEVSLLQPEQTPQLPPTMQEAIEAVQAETETEVTITGNSTVTFGKTPAQPAPGEIPTQPTPETQPTTGQTSGQPAPQPSPEAGEAPEGRQEIVEVRVEFDPSQFYTTEPEQPPAEPAKPPEITSIIIGGVNILSYSTGETIQIRVSDLQDGQLIVSGGIEAESGVIRIEISLDGGVTWIVVMGTEDWEYSFTPQGGVNYAIQIRVTTTDGTTFEYPVAAVLRTFIEAPTALTEPPALEFLEIAGQPFDTISPPRGCAALFMRDHLDNGVLVIRGGFRDPTNSVTRVEVSLNGGATWNETQGGQNWTYHYRPRGEEEFQLALRYTTTDGRTLTDDFSGRLVFNISGKTSRQMLDESVSDLFEAYRDENIMEFMSGVADDFTSSEVLIVNRAMLENAVRRDFSHAGFAIKPSSLQYRVTSVDLPQGAGAADVNIKWNNDQSGAFRTTSTLRYVFAGCRWKLISISGESPFGTYEKLNTPASMELTLSASSVLADESGKVTVTAVVTNQLGDRLPQSTVRFSINPTTAGTFSSSEATTNTNGEASVTFTPARFYGNELNVTITATCDTLTADAPLEIRSDAPPPWGE